MKNSMFKILSLVMVSGAMIACAPQENANASNGRMNTSFSTNEEVTLISRYSGGDYITATYSFRYLTRDNENLTRNNWELLFEGRGNDNTFAVNMVVDDNSFIYDLGERSCKNIRSNYPEDRKKRPLARLAGSEADPSDLTPAKEVKVKVGHCYLTYNNDEDGRVVALFHVKAFVPGYSVTIHEIEVLNVLTQQ